MKNFKYFELVKNTKRPLKKAVDRQYYDYSKLDFEKFNYGILTGKSNDIIILDIDFNKDKNKAKFTNPLFLQHFKSIDDSIKLFNSLTVKTAGGGYHIYFKYDKDIRNGRYGEIDILTNKSYVVSPNSNIDGNKYEIILDTEIKTIPKQLYNYIEELEKKDNITNTTINKDFSLFNDNNDDIRAIKELFRIIDLSNYEDWFKFTTIFKHYNLMEDWDKISLLYDGYNKKQNLKIWKNIQPNEELVDKLIFHYQKINTKEGVKELSKNPYKDYKEIDYNLFTTKPDITINKEKLGFTYYDELIKNNNNKCFIIKSDMGTGKTTSFKHLIKNNPDLKFLCILSRVSLCFDVFKNFKNFGLQTTFYKDLNFKLDDEENIIIQLDSILKLYNVDYLEDDYILFIDEIKSLIMYLFTSTTLDKKRTKIFIKFNSLLQNAKYIIGTDADINDLVFKYLDFLNINYLFVENEYKHNKGTDAEELEDEDKLIELLVKEEKFMVSCDSKRNCEILEKKLKNNGINDTVIITSETKEEYINLDDYNKVIFSPKIVYGVDSIMPRNCYCYHREHTLDPNQLLQQINRNRNIKKLYYLFDKKTYQEPKYLNFQDCYNFKTAIYDYKKKYYIEIERLREDEIKFYNEMLIIIEYINDCYNTNKFLHFINRLKQNHFNVIDCFYLKQKINNKELIKEIKKDKEENINEIMEITKLNEIMKIPEDDLKIYSDILLNPFELTRHFNTSKFFFNLKTSLTGESQLNKREDLLLNKIGSNNDKLNFLRYLEELFYFNYSLDDKIIKITFNNDVEELFNKNNEKIINIYKSTFRDRTTKTLSCYFLLNKVFKSLFGDLVINKRTTKNKKYIYNYYISIDKLEQQLNLYNYRSKTLDKIDINNFVDFKNNFLKEEDTTPAIIKTTGEFNLKTGYK